MALRTAKIPSPDARRISLQRNRPVSVDFCSRIIALVVNPLATARDMTNHAKRDDEGSQRHNSSLKKLLKDFLYAKHH